jgi:amino acid transporter
VSASFTAIPAGAAPDDVARLHQIGYPQQLVRRMGPFGAFAVPFSNISILTGPVTLFGFALATGGPVALVWTWLVLGPLVLCVALALAQICAAFPTSGALYYWSAQLARRHKVLASWVTAWLNALGQLAGTAAAAYSTALFLGAFLALFWGFTITPVETLGLFAVIIVVCAAANSCAVQIVSVLNRGSVLVHVGGVAVIAVALFALPVRHQSVAFVFGHFANTTGFHSTLYVWLLAPLTIMYTMTGLDSPGHMAEETDRAASTAPRAIVRAVFWSWILGFVIILALLFAIQHYSAEASGGAYGVAPAAIIADALGGALAKVLIGWIILAQLLCVMSCFTAMSRMFFACGRDHVFPFGPFLHSVSGRHNVPVRAVWVSALLAFLLGLPAARHSLVLFYAVTGVASTALFLSYAIPIALRLRAGNQFAPDTVWRLPARRLIGTLAVGYVAIAAVLACLPTVYPITTGTFNYTSVALLLTLLGVGCYFAVHGRATYHGPRRFTAREIAVIEDGLV